MRVLTNARGRLPDLLDFKIFHVYQGPHGRDPRVRRTIQFLARKGFLRTDPYPQPYRGLLTLDDVLWACAHATPYFYELVPAARLRFPKHVPGPVPEDLRRVLRALRAGDPEGPDFRGYPYHRIRGWLDVATRDRRASRRLLTRMQLTLPPDLARRIRAAARARKTTIGEWMAAAAEEALKTTR